MRILRFINKIFKNNPGNRDENPSQSPLKKGRSERREAPGNSIPSTLDEINSRLGRLESELKKATTGYKLMLIKNNPDILAEMINGDSIETIDRSLITAKELTTRIREQLEQKKEIERIPAGAPTRLPPDTDNMSSEEKIRYGLLQKM